MTERRPVYLNLLKIRLPVTGIVSLAHRVSGVLLFLSLPFLIWLLERSVASEASFLQVIELLSSMPMRLLMLVFALSLAHHFFAGIRFLLLDIDIGVLKQQSRLSAWLVIVAEIVFMLMIARAVM